MKTVITGPSGVGKTTLINELENEGFKVCHESAHDVRNRIGGRDPYVMQRDMLFRQIEMEYQLQDESVIYDRGFPDILGFSDYFGLKFPFNLECYYDLVIVLNQTPETDFGDRVESSPGDAKHIFETFIMPHYERFNVYRLDKEEAKNALYNKIGGEK